MATLESATERLEAALNKLEGEVEKATEPGSAAGADGADGAETLESLRQQYDDLTNAYESMRERYEALRERNRDLAAKLDKTISRLRRLDSPSSGP